MKEASIYWEHIKLPLDNEYRSFDLFLIVSENIIKYIGFSHGLDFSEELRQSLWMFNLSENEVVVWGGKINNPEGISGQMLSELIICLVRNLKPEYNIPFKETDRQTDIYLLNHGCDLLPTKINNLLAATV